MIKNDQSAFMPESILEKLRKESPGIEDATMWSGNTAEFGDKYIKGTYLSIDESFLNIFSVKLLKGSIEGLKLKDQAFITTDFAKKIVGDKDPIGEKINWNTSTLTIVGLIESCGKKSGFLYDILMNEKTGGTGINTSDFRTGQSETLRSGAVLLNQNANVDSIQSRITNLVKNNPCIKSRIVTLRPFKDVYFDSDIRDDYMSHANSAMIRLLFYVTLAILVLAIFNYINLTTAIGLKRFREVGIKKTLGAGMLTIFRQFFFETFLLCLISIILALGIAFITKPLFESILLKKIEISTLFNDLKSITLCLLFFLLIVLVSGIAPALSASKYTPISLLSWDKPKVKGYTFRNIMNVIQFTISIVLIISFLMVYRQVNYVKHKQLGFNQEQLLRLDICNIDFSKASAFRQKLLTNPGITDVSLSYGGPGERNSTISFNDDSLDINEVSYMMADSNYLKTMGIPLLKGQNLTKGKGDGYLINETYYKKFGIKELHDIHYNGENYIGVVGDFHCKDLHHPISAFCIKPLGKEDHVNLLVMRIKAENMAQTIKFIHRTYDDFLNGPFDYKFYDEWFDSMYKQEENQTATIRIFTILAILISCLGLFGLAEFEANRRTKEINIRRVNGATMIDIMFMLNKKFLMPVLIAFIIACPIAYLILIQWLENFSYKAKMSWWIFALAGLIAMIISLLTISWQSVKAATNNPIESFKYK